MALVESNPFQTGRKAPSFSLLNVETNANNTLSDLKGAKGTVIMFICNHCPFVIHVNDELLKMANDYLNQGIAFIAISSNNVLTHPQDGPSQMKIVSESLGYPFPYLFDETQEVAKAYDAVCTPDFYFFDKDLKSVYHGQLDDSRPGNNIPLSGKDMRNAIDGLLNGQGFSSAQKPSIGCSIKWT